MDLRVKVTSREIFLFSLHHYYHSVPGFISIGCTILALGAVVATWPAQPGFMKAILALAVVLIACTQPFVLYRKAGREALDPQRSKETHFKIDYNGLRVHQGRDKAVIRCKQIIKVGKVSDIYVLYLTKDRAYLFPQRVLEGGKKEQFLNLLREYVPAELRKGI